jgi:BlaI family transcriptional regulator, penicillinase repressor
MKPKLTKLEMRVMEALWSRGSASIRELQESFPAKGRPIYSTIQTIVYRLEAKKAVRRGPKIGNAHIFEPLLSREAARTRWIDDLLSVFGGKAQSLVLHLVESGKLTPADVREADELMRKLSQKDNRR